MRRLSVGIIAAGLLASAPPPTVTGSVHPMAAPGGLLVCDRKPAEYGPGSPADVIPQTLTTLREVLAADSCGGRGPRSPSMGT